MHLDLFKKGMGLSFKKPTRQALRP